MAVSSSQPTGKDASKSASASKTEPERLTPHLVSFGKVRRKRIRRLKKGRGKLVNRIADVLEAVEAELGEAAAGKSILPVVIVVERKRKKKRKIRFPF